MLETILETIKSLVAEEKFDFYGLRAVHSPSGQADRVSVGEVLPCSYRWYDGEPTEEELDGTCALRVNEGTELAHLDEFMREYGVLGQQVALIAGYQGTWGEDMGEVVIRDAVVLAVWEFQRNS